MGGATRTGGCVCGAVRYTIDAAKAFKPYACHCRDCHSRSGGAFTIQMFILTDGLKVEGELVEGRNSSPAGSEILQYACRGCLTRIYSRNPALPQMVTLRAGTLDDSQDLMPAVHLWTASKQAWVTIPTDFPSYTGQPEDPMEWISPLHPPQA